MFSGAPDDLINPFWMNICYLTFFILMIPFIYVMYRGISSILKGRDNE